MLSNTKTIINASEGSQEFNIDSISNKLNALLEEKKLSTKILSEATGISIAAINNLKRGEGNPTIGTLSAICKFFGITLIELLGLEKDTMQNLTSIVSLFDLRFAHQRNENNVSNKMLLELPNKAEDNSVFGVIINNNSLQPLYEKGTIFILAPSQTALDGDIILARIQNQTNSLKRLFIKKQNFHLKNINLEETVESYSKNEVDILGIVMQIIQKTI